MTDLSSWTAYFQDFGQFFNGFLFTLALAVGSFILAMVLGIFFGAMSTSKRPILRILARIFVEFYQNTPLLVQFVIVFYGLPLISDHTIMIPIYWTAVLCVGLYHGAYIAEVIRSGIQSIPSGQMEAALSQGFTYISAMRLIILPQTFRIILPQASRKMLPAIISQFVTVIKDTSLLYSVIALQELFGASQILMGRYFEPEQVFSLYILIALIYFSFNLAISSLSHMLAKRWQQAAE
ncbi:polar amino acid ABC transporter permease [Streptococcus pneumoniae]|nr:polar amino acid ABC transporter permease [Streptococcus pneumoniae]